MLAAGVPGLLEGFGAGTGVVLADVAPHTTVVGIPAKPVGTPSSEAPAETMNQNFLFDSPLSSD